jgi:muramoyltetrapeptide carboxypeptidase LdcA involved in peptidoglycan recycling
VYGLQRGFTTLYGPSIMAGFSQMGALPDFEAHVREMLFDPKPSYTYQPYGRYCDGYPDWSNLDNVGQVNEMKTDDGWRVVQGRGRVEGELVGGCIEVLEFMKGTDYWPAADFWAGKILFFETSEETPTIEQVRRMLRTYGVAGIFARVSAILFGRARSYSSQDKLELDGAIQEIVAGEFEQRELPIVTNMDFGHTDPQLVLPLGVPALLDCQDKQLSLIEAWLE